MVSFNSYGVYLPDAGDESSTEWQPNIRKNWEHYSAHNHDGVNSPRISLSKLDKVFSTVSTTDFIAVPDRGLYYAEVALPPGYNMDNVFIRFKIINGTFTNYEFFPTIEKVSNGTFRFYVNRTDITVKVLFL